MERLKKTKVFAIATLALGMLFAITTQVSAHGNDKYYSKGADDCLSAKDHHCPSFGGGGQQIQ